MHTNIHIHVYICIYRVNPKWCGAGVGASGPEARSINQSKDPHRNKETKP